MEERGKGFHGPSARLSGSPLCSCTQGVFLPQEIQADAAFPDPSFKKGKKGLGSYRLVSFTSWRTFQGHKGQAMSGNSQQGFTKRT